MSRSYSLVLISAALAACVDTGDEGILIVKNVAVGDTCEFKADPNSPFFSRGTYFSASPFPYYLHPQVKSRITAAAGQEDQRTIILKGARVELAFTDTELFTAAELEDMRASGVTRFETRFSAPLSPNGGITDTSVELIYPSLLEKIHAKHPASAQLDGESFRTEVIATVVIFGELGGGEVTSQKFDYPVTICNDCVFTVSGLCPLPADAVSYGNACSAYQDGVVTCCVENGAAVCPARVE